MGRSTALYAFVFVMVSHVDASNKFCEEANYKNVKEICDDDSSRGQCEMLVKTGGEDCDTWCESQGETCLESWDERDDTCKVMSHVQADRTHCSKKRGDQICRCTIKIACKDFDYKNVKKMCDDDSSKGECEMLVKTRGEDCDTWCQAQGQTCVDSWDEQGDTCTVAGHKQSSSTHCSKKRGDQICRCRAPEPLSVLPPPLSAVPRWTSPAANSAPAASTPAGDNELSAASREPLGMLVVMMAMMMLAVFV